MAGKQISKERNFEQIIKNNFFYLDKTELIREWWEKGDDVTLLTRPEPFGKTLNLSMLEYFFSAEYAGRGDLFEGLHIWKDAKYRELQGTYPVIALSFADVKADCYVAARKKIGQIIADLYLKYQFLTDSEIMGEGDKAYFRRVAADMDDVELTLAIQRLCRYLNCYYGKRTIILLDAHDAPLQEAYRNGYLAELTAFTRSLYSSTFKANRDLERAMITGVAGMNGEILFSDVNNLVAQDVLSEQYANAFGFTEKEVLAALEEFDLLDWKREVREWYGGFVFGSRGDMYNPWSVLNFLDTGRLADYWSDTEVCKLAGKVIREGNKYVKREFETLLQGGEIMTSLDEKIAYDQLTGDPETTWSLLVAAGCLKVVCTEYVEESWEYKYHLALTNKEVYLMFQNISRGLRMF